jgi:hypothetical protein
MENENILAEAVKVAKGEEASLRQNHKKTNRGTVRLFVEKVAESGLVLSISGARLEGSSDEEVAKVNHNTLDIKAGGAFTITLANLVAGEEVTLKLSSKDVGLSKIVGTLTAK